MADANRKALLLISKRVATCFIFIMMAVVTQVIHPVFVKQKRVGQIYSKKRDKKCNRKWEKYWIKLMQQIYYKISQTAT